MRKIATKSAFRKSYKKVSLYPNFNKDEFEKIVENLANDIQLEARYHDHGLNGKLKALRECHVCPDILLVYQKTEDGLILYLVDIGKHSVLFKE